MTFDTQTLTRNKNKSSSSVDFSEGGSIIYKTMIALLEDSGPPPCYNASWGMGPLPSMQPPLPPPSAHYQ